MATWDVTKVDGLDPAIAGFWYAYAFGRTRLARVLEGLTPEQLAARPAGFNNSLAALAVHVAGAEVHFAHRILGKEIPADLKTEFLLGDSPTSALVQPEGETVESLVRKLERAADMIREALSSLKAEDLDRELNPGGQAYTMRWFLSLVSYHATNHFGQMQMVKQHLG